MVQVISASAGFQPVLAVPRKKSEYGSVFDAQDFRPKNQAAYLLSVNTVINEQYQLAQRLLVELDSLLVARIYMIVAKEFAGIGGSKMLHKTSLSL